jgi:Tfp pilus assembly protein PilN
MIVRFNLATKPLETHRRFFLFFGVVGTLAAVAFLVLGYHVYQVRKADAAFRMQSDKSAQEIARLSKQRRELDDFFSRRENAELDDRAAYINDIIDARSFNWTRMFMDLEKVLPGGVRVMNVEPNQVNGQAAVKLTVGAASEEAKADFLRALEQSGVFSHLALLSVRAPDQEGTGDKVILELTVVYSRA